MFLELTAQAVITGYLIGMLWSFLSWTRSIHELRARAESALKNRRDRNLQRTLERSARETFSEGLLCLVWPLIVARNLRTVFVVGKDWYRYRSVEKNQ